MSHACASLNVGDYEETNCGYISIERSLTITMNTDGSTESPGFFAVYGGVCSDEEVQLNSKHLCSSTCMQVCMVA